VCIICELRKAMGGKKTCGHALCQSAYLRMCEARVDAARERGACYDIERKANLKFQR